MYCVVVVEHIRYYIFFLPLQVLVWVIPKQIQALQMYVLVYHVVRSLRGEEVVNVVYREIAVYHALVVLPGAEV